MITYTVGDAREQMATIADGTVDLVASSPPFLALRSYLPAGHESKGDEIGSESNPAAFIDMLLGLTAEWGRVLAPHGSIAIELGDTYSGSSATGGDYKPAGEWTKYKRGDLASAVNPPRNGTHWPRAKCLALIPQLYAVALAYGINPLTGQPSPAGRWLVRNVIVWHRPNPAVGALGDKVRPSTSYIVVATRSAKRWFDLTAVRTGWLQDGRPTSNGRVGGWDDNDRRHSLGPITEEMKGAGAPPLDTWFDQYDGTHDTWTLTTQPSSLSHYAMWPAKLAERLILSMCPREVCLPCGQPRRRIEVVAQEPTRPVNPNAHHGRRVIKRPDGPTRNERVGETIGWTDCGHADSWMPGVVLDPFCGSGTTLAVADLHGRDAIGIDLDPRNQAIYPARYDEVKRALFGTPAPMPGQGVLAL